MKTLRLLPLLLVACGAGLEAPQIESPLAQECPTPKRTALPRNLPPPGEIVEPLQPGEARRVLRDQTTTIALSLNSETVFCSALGYSASFLKVSVPDLDWLAHFNHRVEASGLPCAAAGECSEANSPEAVLASNPSLAMVPMRVVLTEHLDIDPAAHTCKRQLVETVTVQLNGRVLRHSAQDEFTDYPFEKCAAIAALPEN